ncbi:MAG: hypothetical protein KDD40_12640, partial [Bdellovibrionales bacterium]|nr:hypothetical protein [Bdellovibrionales bacterium]
MDVEPIKDVNKILDKIAFYLAQRDHAPSELRKKMQHKYDVESFEQALHLAQDRGWLKSPQELSEKITELLNRKLKGYLYIQNYLKN